MRLDIEELWAEPVHERRMAAVELLDLYGHLLEPADLAVVERLIRASKTWALVDGLAATVAGAMVERFPELAQTLIHLLDSALTFALPWSGIRVKRACGGGTAMAVQSQPLPMRIQGSSTGDADLYPSFSQQEYARRHQAVRDAMDREGLDALIIAGGGGGPEVPYLINYRSDSPTWLLYPREGEPSCFIYFHNQLPCAKAHAIIDDVRWVGQNYAERMVEEVQKRGLANRRFGVVSFASISYAQFMALKQGLPDATFVDFGRQLAQIRLIRSEEELVFVRRSGYLTDLTCEALERELRPGLTEHDIKAIIMNAYLKDGGDPGIHFIAVTDMLAPDRFVPWQRTTSRTTTTGSVLITEITVSYWGYSTQIHRPFAIGAEPPKLYQELFDAALECYERIRQISKPGTTSAEIIEASSIIEERGFTSYDSVFHGERGRGPEIGTKSAAHPFEEWTLRENMVHVIQPNPITRDHTAGLQLGAAVVVKPNGGEPLHNYPFKFAVCG